MARSIEVDDDDDVQVDDDGEIIEDYIGDEWDDIDWSFDWDDAVDQYGDEEEFSYSSGEGE